MYTFQMLSAMQQVCLLSCMLILYTAGLILLIQQVYNWNIGIQSIVLLVWLSVWTTELILLIREYRILQKYENRNGMAGEIPVWMIWGMIMASALGLFIMSWKLRQRERNRISARSIREGIDNLPVAVACFREGGQVVLANHRMYRILDDLTGNTVLSEQKLYRVLQDNLAQQMIKNAGTDRPVIELSDGSSWEVVSEQIQIQGENYEQINLAEITEYCQLYRQLESKQKELLEQRKRIQKLSDMVEVIRHEEAVLNSKIRIHNDLGKAILSTRLLLQKKTLTKEEILDGVMIWENAICYLSENDGQGYQHEQGATDQQLLTEILTSAKELGCCVVLQEDGETNHAQAGILRIVLREAVINAVRHAGASEVYAYITDIDAHWVLRITDNGKDSQAELKEGGGLTGIRQQVEAVGGEMRIILKPRFELVVRLVNHD